VRARHDSAHDLVRYLRQYRDSAGLTQQRLAALAGMSLGALRDLEQGRTTQPTQRTVDQLVTVLGLGPGGRNHLLAAQPERSSGADGDSAPRSAGDSTPRSAKEASLRLGILGPLTVWRDGSPVALGGTRQRAVLGALALHHADGLHRDALVDLLWGEDPPPSAIAIVHSQISHLRRLLEPDRPTRGGRILVSEGAQYCLHPRVLSDADEFAARVEQAEAVASAGDLTSACAAYAAALDLWRGEVLADLEVLRAHPAAVELGWRWASVITAYAEVALTAGSADRVVRPLRGLTVREPLNEKAHALLVRSLTATGQRAAALDLFERTRRRLVEELGASPGPELADAHLRALRETAPATPGASGSAAAAGGARDRPGRSALPQVTPYFAGRSAELGALTAMTDQGTQARGAVVTVAIDGTAGVGKTTLAVQWAHQMADRFPDGQLYVNLRGYGPVGTPLDPAKAIRLLLEDLGIVPERIPVGLDERIGLYRRLLASQRMAIVLDNAHDPDQVRPLLPGSPGCLAVVTSRRQLTGLSVADGAYLLSLDLFSEQDARELLERRLGAGRICAETEAVSEVIRLCGYLPLSLSIAAARAAARPAQPLAAQAAKLRNAHTRLDGLSTGDVTTDPRAVFSWSYQQVSATAAQLFRLIGVHPGPDFTAAAAASLAGIPQNQARQTLAELAQAHLLAEPIPGRHACHDLLRDYAGEQALVHETQETRRAAIRRLLDFYLHTTFAASRLLHPYRDLITIEEPLPLVTPEVLADRQQALEWFRAERPVLLAAIETAASEGLDRHAWQLSWTMATFLTWQGHWQELVRSQQTALAAARRLGDRSAQATALHYVGQTQYRLGLAEAADVHQHEALELGRQLDNGIIQGRALLELARIADRQDRRRDAVTYAERSLPHFQAAKSPSWTADALNTAAWYRSQLGDHLEALAYCEKALAAQRELGNLIGEAATLDSLGYIHHQLGHYDQAIACFQEAVKVQGDTLIAEERATVLVHLGDAFHAAGQAVQAGSAWHQALSILEDMGDPGADAVRQKLEDASLPSELRSPDPGTREVRDVRLEDA
jgi:DNA-binding SARP family transcriptional activator/tetratricopeptide (TPR) repeat protein/transcriptional regulator with XRE-family HTH domain